MRPNKGRRSPVTLTCTSTFARSSPEGVTARALRGMTADVDQVARDLVDRALDRGSIDAVEILARAMPLNVVPDLVGWEEEVRPKLMGWGVAPFNAVGGRNARCQPAIPESWR